MIVVIFMNSYSKSLDVRRNRFQAQTLSPSLGLRTAERMEKQKKARNLSINEPHLLAIKFVLLYCNSMHWFFFSFFLFFSSHLQFSHNLEDKFRGKEAKKLQVQEIAKVSLLDVIL